jgi:hypothetical protein
MPATARPTHSHSHAGGQAGAKPKLYNPRHSERTLLYKTIAEHFETWFELASAGQFDGQGDHHTPKPYVRQAFRKYLECGIFAHGFARAWVVMTAHTTTSWPIPAKAVASAPRATPGAWWRRRRT